MKLINFLILMLLMLFCPNTWSQTKVTFINPGFSSDNPTGNFWQHVSLFMQEAANDLNIKLSVRYADRNHILMKQLVRDALSETDSYLILVDEKSVITTTLINSTQTHPAILFLLNEPNDEQIKRLRGKGFGILGSILPDNYQAGKLLTKKLLTITQASSSFKRHEMLALLGESATLAAQQREQGLLSFSNRQPTLKMKQRVSANWSEDEAYQLTLGLVKRFPNTELIWAANDAMAFGAVKALHELELRDQIKVGGINWDKGQDLKLDVSVGGHVTLGGLAIVKIADHINSQVPFEANYLHPIFKVFDKKYEKLYRAIHSHNIETIDFSQFSINSKTRLKYNLDNLNKFFK